MRLTADEERERLVLVRRPRGQARKEKGGDGEHAARRLPTPNHASANSDPGGARRALGVVATCVTTRRYPRKHAASLAGCRSTNTVARTGTCSRSSSGWTTLRLRRARSAARRRSSACSSRRRPLQGLGVLLDRLRALAQARRRQGVERRRRRRLEKSRSRSGASRPSRRSEKSRLLATSRCSPGRRAPCRAAAAAARRRPGTSGSRSGSPRCRSGTTRRRSTSACRRAGSAGSSRRGLATQPS